MKKTFSLLLLFAAAAASADVAVATVDMDLVVLSHPKNAENREEVAKVEEKAEADRNQLRGEITEISRKLDEAVVVAQRPTSSDADRAQARAEAEKLREQGRQKIEELRRTEAAAAARIRREALSRFAEVKKDVDAKVAALAAEKKLDLVLDSAAMRSGLPLPLVVWAAKPLDLTDEVIAAIGGDRAAAEEALAKGDARLFPPPAEAAAPAAE